MPHLASASTTTRTATRFAPEESRVAPADASRAVLFPKHAPPPTPAVQQLFDATKQLARDPFGTIIGAVGQQFQDLKTALFSLTQEELDNPLIRASITKLGVDPNTLKPTATANDVLLASQRTAALAGGALAGVAVGPIAGRAARAAFGSGAAGAAAAGTADATAFGAAFGTLLPVEEGQTRAGNILTNTVLTAPFGTLGGLVSHGIRAKIKASGADPLLEAPETAPDPTAADPQGPSLADRARGLTADDRPVIPSDPTTVVEPEVPTVTGSARDRVLAAFDYEGPAKAPLVVRDVADRIYSAVVDDLFPINRLTKNLLQEQEARGISRGAAPREVLRKGSSVPLDGIFPAEPKAVALDPKSLTPSVRLPGIDDPTVLADLVKSSTAVATQFIEQGPLDYATRQPIGPGLKDILRGVQEKGLALDLDAVLSAPRTLQLAERGIKTRIPVDAAAEVLQKAPAELLQVADDVFKYNDQVLKWQTDTGWVPPEHAELFRQMNQQYVPLPEVFDEAAGIGGGPKEANRLANIPGVKKIKGGAGKRIPPTEATIRNTYFGVSMGSRYAVFDAIVRLAERVPDSKYVRFLGKDIEAGLEKTVAEGLSKELLDTGVALNAEQAGEMGQALARLMPSRKPNTFWVWREGKKLYAEVDPVVAKTLLGMDREQMGVLTKILAAPASVQRIGFTSLSPAFPAKNIFRDALGVAVNTRYGWTPPLDMAHGVMNALGRGDLLKAYKRSGAEHATIARLLSADREASRLSVAKVLEGRGPVSELFRDAMRHPLTGTVELARSLSDLSEVVTRSPEFTRAMAATGGDPFRSAFAARDLLNFSRAGSALRVANQLVPFLNVAVQDLDKTARSLFAEGSKRSRAVTLQGVAKITVPTMALYLLNRDDEHYQELPWWQKDYFFNIPNYTLQRDETGLHAVRNEKYPFIPIPRLSSVGMVFGALPERIMAWVDAQAPETFQDNHAFDDFSGSVVGGLVPNLMPGFAGPLLEATSGEAGFERYRQRPLIPQSELRLIKEEQAGTLQRETVRLIGRVLKVSPRKVEHILNGYSGGISRQALRVSDELLKRANLAKAPAAGAPEGVEGIPVVSDFARAFLRREPLLNSQAVTRYERNRDEVERMMATTRMLLNDPERTDEAERFIDTFGDMIVSYGVFSNMSDLIRLQREAIFTTRADKTIPLAQREALIRDYGRAIRSFAQVANELYADIKRQYDPPVDGIHPLTGGIGVSVTPRPPRP